MTGTKKWWLSKAVWASIIAIAVAGYNAAVVQFGIPVIPEFVFMILAALGLWGRISATTEIK